MFSELIRDYEAAHGVVTGDEIAGQSQTGQGHRRGGTDGSQAYGMSVTLDTGAFVTLERDDQATWRRLKAARQPGSPGSPPVTHGGVTAQGWHGGTGRQTRLARALHAVETVPLDDGLGRRTGVLLARSGLNDAVDAALAAIACS